MRARSTSRSTSRRSSIGAAVAILAWIRWRDTGETGRPVRELRVRRADRHQRPDDRDRHRAARRQTSGWPRSQPGEAPIYLWTLTRAAVAALLVIGAARSLRREPPPLPPTFLEIVPAVGPRAGRGHAVRPRGDPAAGARRRSVRPERAARRSAPLRRLDRRSCSSRSRSSSASSSPRSCSAACTSATGSCPTRSCRRGSSWPPSASCTSRSTRSSRPGIVTSTDALRLVFYAILVMGIQAELGADFAALRRANAELKRLREVDAANATLAERTRLAREIHDGLAQDLWYAKLKQGRLTQNESLDAEAQDDRRRGPRRHRLGPGRGAPGGHGDARRPVGGVEPRGGAPLVRRGLRRPVRRARRVRGRGHAPAPAAADRGRGPAHRPGGAQQRPPPRRCHARAGPDRARRPDLARSRSPTMGAGSTRPPCPPERYGLRGMRERAELVGAVAGHPVAPPGRDDGSPSKSRPRRSPRA